MSGYRGHLVGAGILCGVYVTALSFALSIDVLAYKGAFLHGWQFLVALFVLSLLFGLWPDVDTNSKGQDIFYGAMFALDILLIATKSLEAAAYLGFLAMLPIVGKHRGWTHTKIAMILVPLPILLLPNTNPANGVSSSFLYYGAAEIGYFSHLLLDGLIFKRFRIKN